MVVVDMHPGVGSDANELEGAAASAGRPETRTTHPDQAKAITQKRPDPVFRDRQRASKSSFLSTVLALLDFPLVEARWPPCMWWIANVLETHSFVVAP
jgi:hypothetical protein